MIYIDTIKGEDYMAVYRMAGEIDGIVQHAEHVYKIMADHFTDSFFIAREKREDGSSFILGFMMGFISQKFEGQLFVWQIAVSAESQGKHVGSALLKHTLEHARRSEQCKSVMATVETTNIGSQRLFESLGFTIESKKFKNPGQILTVESGKEAVVNYYGSGTDQIFYLMRT
ncbi:MAG: GNAT family N-acetyltransferase [Candidatus Delongbacteria bacterium]